MSRRRSKGRLPPFIPIIKSTWNHPAMKALSHGAFRLYVALRAHYHSELGNAVYMSVRDAMKELGASGDSVQRWFRELQYYGFIVMTEPGCLGVDGMGKAPHYRLTESSYIGQSPTRDFDRWNGTKFKDEGQTAAQARLRARQAKLKKKTESRTRNRVHPVPETAYIQPAPPVDQSVPETAYIQPPKPVPETAYITRLTTALCPAGASVGVEQPVAGIGHNLGPSLEPEDLSIPDFLRRAN